MQDRVSIIIPCYNASEFIKETLQSVFLQSHHNYEIIIVDDGSTDNSKEIINEIKEHTLTYIFQENQGVSAARNNGFTRATGDYYLFLDADDLLESDFLKQRILALQNDQSALFACSKASLINGKGEALDIDYEPVCKDVELEICTHKSNYCSCPSNYLISKKIKEHRILFEEKLSNSADRFFLLQLNQIGKGKLVTGNSKLKYRIHSKSMSKTITPKNIADLIFFYKLVIKNNLVPKPYFLKFKLKTFRIIFSEALLIKKIPLAFKAIYSVLLKF